MVGSGKVCKCVHGLWLRRVVNTGSDEKLYGEKHKASKERLRADGVGA